MKYALYSKFRNQNSLCAGFKIKFVPVFALAYVSPPRIMWRKTNVGNLCVVKSFFIFSHPLPSYFATPLLHTICRPQLDSCEPLSVDSLVPSAGAGTGPAIIFFLPRLHFRFRFFGFLQNEAQRSVWQTDFSQTQIRALKRKGKKKCRNFHKIRITAVILYEGPPSPLPLADGQTEQNLWAAAEICKATEKRTEGDG